MKRTRNKSRHTKLTLEKRERERELWAYGTRKYYILCLSRDDEVWTVLKEVRPIRSAEFVDMEH